MITATGIMARPIVAWLAPSPSSPAPSARRYAALGLDARRSQANWPTCLRCRDLDGYNEPEFAFTEGSYTNFLTIPWRASPAVERTLAGEITHPFTHSPTKRRFTPTAAAASCPRLAGIHQREPHARPPLDQCCDCLTPPQCERQF